MTGRWRAEWTVRNERSDRNGLEGVRVGESWRGVGGVVMSKLGGEGVGVTASL